jgi:ERCC4-type nuclease
LLLIDYRAGSRELIQPLRDLGLPVEKTTLNFGDVAFSGNGRKGKSVDIGIEFKTLNETIGSIRDGRLAGHQLPGLSPFTEQPTFDYAWLLIEGAWTSDRQGLVCAYSKYRQQWAPVPGKMNASEYEGHLLTYFLNAGIMVKETNTRRDTLRWIARQYRWWTDTDSMDDHKSHLAMHKPTTFIPLNERRQAMTRWPGVGVRVSLAAERAFGSVANAAAANARQWATLEVPDKNGKSKLFGMKHAERVVEFLRGTK